MKTRLWKKLLSCLLSVTLLLPTAGMLHAGAAENATTPLPAYEMSLYRAVPDESGGWKPDEEAVTGGNVSLKDTFFVRVYWDNLIGVEANVLYSITDVPAAFGVPSEDGSMTFQATLPDGINAKDFVTLSWTKDDPTLHLVFKAMGQIELGGEMFDLLPLLSQARIYYQCSLDKDSLNADDQGEIEIAFPGTGAVTVTVEELTPKPPKLEKTAGALSSDGTATWTLSYTHPTDAYLGERPVELVDTLPEGLELLGTPTVSIDGAADPSATVTTDNNTLTYTLPQDLTGGAEVEITYTTRLTNGALSNIWTHTKDTDTFAYTNAAEGRNADGAAIDGLTASDTLTVDKNWPGFSAISKGGRSIPGDPWNIEWTVTVQTAGQSFEHLYLIDTMGKGLLLDTGSVKVNGSGHACVTQDADGKTEMTLKLVKGGSPSPAAETYQITYTTAIDENYFKQTGAPEDKLTDKDLENSARLDYAWPAGTEPGAPPMPPAVSKTPGSLGISSALIQKAATGKYDPVTHALTWNITVNPNKVNMTTTLFEDDLSSPALKQSFSPTARLDLTPTETTRLAIETAIETALGADASKLTTVTLENDKLTVALTGLGEKSFTFPLTTYVADPAVWGGNVTNRSFPNTVKLLQSGTQVDGASIFADVDAKATQSVTGNVLKKAHTGYDLNTKKLTWTLTVNENATDLGDVTITDTLPEGLSCDSADALLDGAAFSGDDTFTAADREITITLKNVTGMRTVTFQTTVDINTDAFKNNTSVAFENKAAIISQGNSASTQSNLSTAEVGNAVLTKASKTSTDSKTKVSYTVELNPLGMDLLDGLGTDVTDLKLTDTLADGLYLDLDTVALWNATATTNHSGDNYTVTLAKGAAVDPKPALSYSAPSNSFTIGLPSATGRYILTYDAYVVRANVDLSNSIKLTGSAIPTDSENDDAAQTYKLAAFGGASFNLPKGSFFSLQLEKVDKNGQQLKGAVFGLYTAKSDGALLVRATCDETTGICTLAVPISQIKGIDTLYWKELEAPVGYEVNDEWHEVATKDGGPADVLPMFNYSPEDAVKASISIRKVGDRAADGAAEPLAGAKFALYANETCLEAELVAAETPVDEHGLLTFTGLYPDRTYWLKETSAPEGYVLSDAPAPLVAATTGTVHDIANDRANVTLNIVKTETGAPTVLLKGAEFGLFEDAACTLPVNSRQTTDENGVCAFQNLYPHTTYYLKELKAPDGYTVKDDTAAEIVTAGNDQTIALTLENDKIPTSSAVGTIQLTKTDESGETPLAGAVFALYRGDKTSLVRKLTTDAKGVCTFYGLPIGSYYLREVAAPAGYMLDDSWIAVTVRNGATAKVAAINSLSPTDPEPPTDPEVPVDPEQPTPTEPDRPETPLTPETPVTPEPATTPGGEESILHPETPSGNLPQTGSAPAEYSLVGILSLLLSLAVFSLPAFLHKKRAKH